MVTSLLGAYALAVALQSSPQAVVAGTVSDAETGEPLPGAVVTLTDADRGTVTGEDGRYAFADVPPGPQHLTVALLGHASRTLHVLVPRSGRLRIDVSLESEPIPLEGLDVLTDFPVRGVESGDSGTFPDRTLSNAALRYHPSLAQPDGFRALAGGEVVVDPEAPIGVHVRGGAADQTVYLLDGIPVLDPHHAAGLFSAWNPDALSEIGLLAAAPSPGLPDALSGVISATTRDPGPRPRLRSRLSNAEGSVTVDGPLGIASGGYLVSWRAGFPGSVPPKDEPSYLRGETADLIGKVRLAALDGRLTLLLFDAENEIHAATAMATDAGPVVGPGRNQFEWRSRSVGAVWTRAWPGFVLRVAGWRARADASSEWHASDPPARLASRRRDAGVQVGLERRGSRSASEAGLRLQRIRTGYRTGSGAGTAPSWSAAGTTAVIGAYAAHSAAPASSLNAWAGASLAATRRSIHFAPRARLTWRPGERLTWTLAYGRTHQFTQSLRNPESVVSHVFPAETVLGAEVAGVPVPRGDQLVVAGEWRPAAGVRFGVQAFARALRELLLVAPREPGPFATGTFARGSAEAAGISIDLAAGGARYGVLANYGWQKVRFDHGDAVYVPRHGTAHLVDAGAVFFPTATSSLRLAVSAGWGRRATQLGGPFEWEACNILDQGCEFAGSPQLDGPVGGIELPPYVRVDLGARKHWHFRLGGRDVLVGAFGTLTNVLARANTLTYAVDPETGRREAVEMLPRSPLVVGLDWRF